MAEFETFLATFVPIFLFMLVVESTDFLRLVICMNIHVNCVRLLAIYYEENVAITFGLCYYIRLGYKFKLWNLVES